LRTQSIDELFDEFDDVEDNDQWVAEYVPPGRDLDEEFKAFGNALWGWGNFTFIIDESSEIQSPGQVNPVLAQYMRRCPRREKGDKNPVDVIQTTHFPVDLNKVSIGLADEAYIFKLTRERDYFRVRTEFGEQVATAVSQLKTPESYPPGREVVKVNVDTGEFFIMTDPEQWHVEMRKPKNDEEEFLYVRSKDYKVRKERGEEEEV
jgi:hypothetical protein